MLTLQTGSLNWALAHILKYGDTGMFPLPFEYWAIKHDWGNIRQYLANQDILEWTTRPHRMLLSPKGRYGFRIITQLDPLDFMVFAAVVKEIAQDIEDYRIPTSQDIVFSYRYSPDENGQLFDPSVGYTEFVSACRLILDNNRGITHVATADIADFYPRIYHHRLDGALQNASGRASHRNAIMHLLSGWNGTETFGIPVGSAPCRLLAELAISDVDQALLANGVQFIRFNDDYRIFATSHAEAYRHIAFLANTLFRNHGLTLQAQKTTVVTVETFRNRFLPTPIDRETASLRERFEDLVNELQLTYPYASIAYDDLDEEDQRLVDSMNLVDLFTEELDNTNGLDLSMMQFILKRLADLGDKAILMHALDNIDALYPIFPDIILYIRRIRDALSHEEKRDVGGRIIELLDNSIISELDYHRMWALDLFTHSTEWNNSDAFFRLLNSAPDLMSRRQLILAMGRSAQRHWFQSQWRSLFDETHWPRRALLAGASCLPPDARRHWYRSVDSSLDPLEKAVVRWVRQNPFA